MAEKEEAKTEEAAEGAGSGKSKKKLIIIIVVVLLVVLGAVGFFVLGGKKPEENPEGAEVVEQHHYATAQLDPFIVNLSESSSFLKVTLLLEYDAALLSKVDAHGGGGGGGGGGGHGAGGEEKKGGLPPIMEERKPMIRDSVIRVLAAKKTAEVLSPDGKESMKQELIEAINEALGLDEGPVVNVYYTEFIIQ